jgi:hypothetical protein
MKTHPKDEASRCCSPGTRSSRTRPLPGAAACGPKVNLDLFYPADEGARGQKGGGLMVSEDGVFGLNIKHDGVPGVVEPSVSIVRGTLSPGALNRFRWIEAKRTAAYATSALRAAVERRMGKRDRTPGVFRVSITDFSN